MSLRLRNRKAAEARLGTFLDNLALPPALIDGVLLAAPDGGFAVGVLLPSANSRHDWEVDGMCWMQQQECHSVLTPRWAGVSVAEAAAA